MLTYDFDPRIATDTNGVHVVPPAIAEIRLDIRQAHVRACVPETSATTRPFGGVRSRRPCAAAGNKIDAPRRQTRPRPRAWCSPGGTPRAGDENRTRVLRGEPGGDATAVLLTVFGKQRMNEHLQVERARQVMKTCQNDHSGAPVAIIFAGEPLELGGW
ncbi:hypothetical protein [Embleya sp. NBC_00896]|uniref:hypothetical protein n=1 Tax=Embleya sp. NBC_00896 TaxID=2975961 RepID=UPI003869B90A|nr:hypothetical protein OG928_16360 [Embleya sp. NBC_00896]